MAMKLLLLDRPADRILARDPNTVYFGPWAQPIETPDDLLSPRFVPYPDNDAVYDAAIRSVNQAEKILILLHGAMPEITGVTGRGFKFWSLLYGHPVVSLCGMIEDINARIRALPDQDYIVGVPQGEDLWETPSSLSTFSDLLFCTDSFRCQMITMLLKERFGRYKEIAYKYTQIQRLSETEKESRALYLLNRVKHHPNRIKERILEVYRRLAARFFVRKDAVYSIVWDTEHLFLSLFKQDYVLKSELLKESEQSEGAKDCGVDLEKRRQLAEALPEPYGQILARTLPVTCLEGLKRQIARVDLSQVKKYKNLSRLYTHGRAFVEPEFERIGAALLADRGIKIYSVQHGGGINYRAHPSIFLEGGVAEQYISWGFDNWHSNRTEVFSKLQPRSMPSLYLSQLRKKRKGAPKNTPGKKWKVIFLVLSENKQVKWLYSPLFPDLAADYFQRQAVLFGHFEGKTPSMVKLYPVEYGWHHKSWVENRFPGLACRVGGKNFVDLAPEGEIVIVDYNSTGFLEMLVLEHPFLCTWNREWYKGNELFEKCLEHLKAVGIFYETPQELISAYDREISRDIKGWWKDAGRRQAIQSVADKIANTSVNARQMWYEELIKR